MKKLKKILPFTPEIILLICSLLWIIDILAGNQINFVMPIISILLAALLIWKNKFLALTLSILLGIGSCYMLLALISEFREFPIGNPEGNILLLTGSLIFIFLLVMAIFMPIKYFQKNKNSISLSK